MPYMAETTTVFCLPKNFNVKNFNDDQLNYLKELIKGELKYFNSKKYPIVDREGIPHKPSLEGVQKCIDILIKDRELYLGSDVYYNHNLLITSSLLVDKFSEYIFDSYDAAEYDCWLRCISRDKLQKTTKYLLEITKNEGE